MIEVITDLRIYSFDGRVFEIFEIDGDSKRFHIAFINSIEVEERRRGNRINMSYSNYDRPVIYGMGNEEAQVRELIRAIVEAKS